MSPDRTWYKIPGAFHLSYTLVLDDDWPPRRTAEKLGAKVCANCVTCRRNF